MFYPALESLRGVGALMVALSHSLGALRIEDATAASVNQALKLLGNGGAGVTIFFVLSGFVLACSMEGANSLGPRAWAAFWLRRLARIWPAMLAVLAACALALASLSFTERFDAASAEYYRFWREGISLSRFAANAFFTDFYVNPVTWTLQVEMWGALFFPLLYLAMRASRRLAALLLAALAGYFLAIPLYAHANTGFVFMFLLGIFARELQRTWSKWPRPALLATACTSFALCCASERAAPLDAPLGWLLLALFATLLTAALAALPQSQGVPLLDRPVARFFGRISYSLYLWHFPVLYLTGTWMFREIDGPSLMRAPNAWQIGLFFATAATTVAIATLSYTWIERPFVAAARRLTGRG